MIRSKKRNRQLWSPTVGASGWSESTLAEQAWEIERGRASRWAIAGAVLGIVAGLVLFAPAAWVAKALASATDERILFTDARGTVWSGSAVPVLTGGLGSRDASYLPGRVEWTMWPGFGSLELALRQACCIDGSQRVSVRPGFGRTRATVTPGGSRSGGVVAGANVVIGVGGGSAAAPAGTVIGQWPSAWLAGLGTPWNTLQLGGNVRASSSGFTVEQVEGRWRLDGRVDLDLERVSSRLTTLETLGSYRVSLNGGNGVTLLSVSTQDGPLQLTGSGSVGPGGVKFRGEARSAGIDEAALSNLLNIIGRRDGARSIISIG